jgi:hypothetical protein
MEQNEAALAERLEERFNTLPKVVQDAISSADVEKRLRELANTHRLHLDQWTALENEVMLALLGFQKMEDLAKNIQSEVGVDAATAAALAEDISKIVFEPIRHELERQLEHPAAAAEKTSEMDDMRTQMLAGAAANTIPATQVMPIIAIEPVIETTPATPAIAPATPPVPAPTGKVERSAISPAYTPSVASHERKTIEGDPYREQLT